MTKVQGHIQEDEHSSIQQAVIAEVARSAHTGLGVKDMQYEVHDNIARLRTRISVTRDLILQHASNFTLSD